MNVYNDGGGGGNDAIITAAAVGSFYRMKCMHSILSKKEGGKKGLINGNGVSTNMAGDEEELTRS
jgi:hypothetical protein